MEAVSEAENVTFALISRFGNFILQNGHNILKYKRGLLFSHFRILDHRTD